MTFFKYSLAELYLDERGSMMIESAFVIPVLGMLSLGGFEASQAVARNTELQSAMAEATAISLAKMPRTQAEIDTIEDIVEDSSGLADEQVTISRSYRCNTDTTKTSDGTACAEGDLVSQFIDIKMKETYTPVWTHFGIGGKIDMTLTRSVQIA